MRLNRLLPVLILLAWPGIAATFGTVVYRTEGFSDIVLDESRNRLYLVNTTSGEVDVYSTATNPPSPLTPPIQFSRNSQPLSAALSRDRKRLYVTCYGNSALAVVDIDRRAVSNVPLAAAPQGVAVGYDERVVVSTIGTGQAQAGLIVYDPAADAAHNLTAVVITPPPPTPPILPPPSGRIFLQNKGELLASPDGRVIVGVHNLANNTRTVFVYDPRSATVLRSRSVTNVSPVLSIAPDGSKFMAGITLFDTETLAVLAQQNAANAPFVFQGGNANNFNTQQNQGGSVFTPDGTALYSAFNIAPVQSPAARANVSQLLVNDPDNLMVKLGLQLTENLAGKMVTGADGSTVYGLSESGFMKLPVGNIYQSPLAVPAGPVVMLASDQCGVTAQQQAATVAVRNAGAGRMSVTTSLLQLPNSGPVGLGGAGGPGGGGLAGLISILLPPVVPGAGGLPAGVTANVGNQQAATIQTSPFVTTRPTPGRDGADVSFQFNPLAGRAPGTVAPHDFLIQSPEAINIPPNVRVYQNYRNAEAKGAVLPVPIGVSNSEGLVDMVVDNTRQRLYMANSGLNRVEVFDMRRKLFLDPIKVGQLPRSLALGSDGVTLYVANSGGEHISIVDLDKGRTVGRVKFPPIPFNAAFSLVTASVIANSQRGLQVIMSDGTLWKVVGDAAQPRVLNPSVFGSSRTIPGPLRTMAATPDGERVLLLAGNGMGYLYDVTADDYILAKQVAPTPITGYFGPLAAGPRGRYYLVNSVILNESLTPIGSAPTITVNPGTGTGTDTTDPNQPPTTGPITGPVPGGFPTRGTTTVTRPVAAVAPAGDRNFVRFSGPVRLTANQLATDAGVVELVEVQTGRTLGFVSALEAPLASVVGNQRTNTNGRTMAVDAAGSAAYAITTSGLSVLPIDTSGAAIRDTPTVNRNGVVSTASYLPQVAPGGLFSIFGRNLGTAGSGTVPFPTILGGTCVTLNSTPVPLTMTSPGQVNGQIPPNLAAGRYTLTIRSIDKQLASTATTLTVSKYAPAVFTSGDGQAAILHMDGRYVSKDAPAHRDEPLVIYATGLGPTKGGKVTAGAGAPASPLAVTDKIQVFFGNPGYKEAEMIVEWSGLVPGSVGLYQVNIRVPGAHIKGNALPVQLRIGGVNSPSTGPAVPYVAVD